MSKYHDFNILFLRFIGVFYVSGNFEASLLLVLKYQWSDDIVIRHC